MKLLRDVNMIFYFFVIACIFIGDAACEKYQMSVNPVNSQIHSKEIDKRAVKTPFVSQLIFGHENVKKFEIQNRSHILDASNWRYHHGKDEMGDFDIEEDAAFLQASNMLDGKNVASNINENQQMLEGFETKKFPLPYEKEMNEEVKHEELSKGLRLVQSQSTATLTGNANSHSIGSKASEGRINSRSIIREPVELFDSNIEVDDSSSLGTPSDDIEGDSLNIPEPSDDLASDASTRREEIESLNEEDDELMMRDLDGSEEEEGEMNSTDDTSADDLEEDQRENQGTNESQESDEDFTDYSKDDDDSGQLLTSRFTVEGEGNEERPDYDNEDSSNVFDNDNSDELTQNDNWYSPDKLEKTDLNTDELLSPSAQDPEVCNEEKKRREVIEYADDLASSDFSDQDFHKKTYIDELDHIKKNNYDCAVCLKKSHKKFKESLFSNKEKSEMSSSIYDNSPMDSLTCSLRKSIMDLDDHSLNSPGTSFINSFVLPSKSCPVECLVDDKNIKSNQQPMAESWLWNELNPSISYHSVGRASIGFLVDGNIEVHIEIVRRFLLNLMMIFSRDSAVILAHYRACIGELPLDKQPMLKDWTDSRDVFEMLLNKDRLDILGKVGDRNPALALGAILNKVDQVGNEMSTQIKIIIVVANGISNPSEESLGEMKAIKQMAEEKGVKIFVILLGGEMSTCFWSLVTNPVQIFALHDTSQLLYGGKIDSKIGTNDKNVQNIPDVSTGVLLLLQSYLQQQTANIAKSLNGTIVSTDGIVSWITNTDPTISSASLPKKQGVIEQLAELEAKDDLLSLKRQTVSLPRKRLGKLRRANNAQRRLQPKQTSQQPPIPVPGAPFYDVALMKKLSLEWEWSKYYPSLKSGVIQRTDHIFVLDSAPDSHFSVMQKFAFHFIRLFPTSISRSTLMSLESTVQEIYKTKSFSVDDDVKKAAATISEGITFPIILSPILTKFLAPVPQYFFKGPRVIFLFLRRQVSDVSGFRYLAGLFKAKGIDIYVMGPGLITQQSSFSELTLPNRVFVSDSISSFMTIEMMDRIVTQLKMDYGAASEILDISSRLTSVIPSVSRKSSRFRAVSRLGRYLSRALSRSRKSSTGRLIGSRQRIARPSSRRNSRIPNLRSRARPQSPRKSPTIASPPALSPVSPSPTLPVATMKVGDVASASVHFMVDSSFNTEMFRIRRLISGLISTFIREATYVSISSFGSKVHRKINFEMLNDQTQIMQAVEQLKGIKKTKRMTGQALYEALQSFGSALPGSPLLLIVILNGPSEDDYKVPSLELRKNGIRVMVLLDHKSDISKQEAHSIASAPQLAFKFKPQETTHVVNTLVPVLKAICAERSTIFGDTGRYFFQPSEVSYFWNWKSHNSEIYYRSLASTQISMLLDLTLSPDRIIHMGYNVLRLFSRRSPISIRTLGLAGDARIKSVEFRQYADSSSLELLLQGLTGNNFLDRAARSEILKDRTSNKDDDSKQTDAVPEGEKRQNIRYFGRSTDQRIIGPQRKKVYSLGSKMTRTDTKYSTSPSSSSTSSSVRRLSRKPSAYKTVTSSRSESRYKSSRKPLRGKKVASVTSTDYPLKSSSVSDSSISFDGPSPSSDFSSLSTSSDGPIVESAQYTPGYFGSTIGSSQNTDNMGPESQFFASSLQNQAESGKSEEINLNSKNLLRSSQLGSDMSSYERISSSAPRFSSSSFGASRTSTGSVGGRWSSRSRNYRSRSSLRYSSLKTKDWLNRYGSRLMARTWSNLAYRMNQVADHMSARSFPSVTGGPNRNQAMIVLLAGWPYDGKHKRHSGKFWNAAKRLKANNIRLYIVVMQKKRTRNQYAQRLLRAASTAYLWRSWRYSQKAMKLIRNTFLKHFGRGSESSYHVSYRKDETFRNSYYAQMPRLTPVLPIASSTFLTDKYLANVQHLSKYYRWRDIVPGIRYHHISSSLNVIFLVDTNSMKSYFVVRDLLKNMIRMFSYRRTRFTLVTIGQDIKARFISRSFNNHSVVVNLVNKIRSSKIFLTQKTAYGRGLRYIYSHVVPQLIWRAKTLVILVATHPSADNILSASRMLQNRGITISTIGVGNKFKQDELVRSASNGQLYAGGPISMLPIVAFRLEFAYSLVCHGTRDVKKVTVRTATVFQPQRSIYVSHAPIGSAKDILLEASTKFSSKRDLIEETPDAFSEKYSTLIDSYKL